MNEDKYVIIHVDDSYTAREVVKGALEDEGYIVHSAEDAQDLEQRLLSDPSLRKSVDIFVLDIEMPDIL